MGADGTTAVLSAALVAAPVITGCGLGAVLRPRDPVGAILAAYVVAWACVIGVVTALSPFDLVSRTPVATVEVCLAVAAGVLWARAGAPIPRVRRGPQIVLLADRKVTALATCVGLSLAYSLALVVIAAPNNHDSMTYHLPRVAQWLASRSVGWIEHATTDRLNVFPPGAEIGVLHTVLAFGSDRFVELPQFFALLALIFAIYGLARRLGHEQTPAALAALAFATMSAAVLQSTTTQNDLVVASFVAAATFFILSTGTATAALAGLAVALALATKLTAVFALPLIGLLAVVGLRTQQRVTVFASSCAVFSALLVLPVAIRNVAQQESLIGGDGIDENRADSSLGAVASTLARVGHRFLDLSGYRGPLALALILVGLALALARIARPSRVPRAALETAIVLASPVLVAVAALGSRAVVEGLGADITDVGGSVVNLRADEDVSFFGPLALVLLVPGAVMALRDTRVGRSVQVILALAVPVVAIEMALVYRYNDWWGRLLLVPVALSAPLMAGPLRRPGVAWGAVAIAVSTMLGAHAYNAFKPTGLDVSPAVWNLTRNQTMALVTTTPNAVARAYEAFAELVPRDACVGLVAGNDDPVYPLYDTEQRPRITLLRRADPEHDAASAGLRFVAIGPSAAAGPFRGSWDVRELDAGWQLASRPAGDDRACA